MRLPAPNINTKKKHESSDLVKSMILRLPQKLLGEVEFTQQYVASLIGCHRHWFRKHKKRYNLKTGELDEKGLTPLEIIKIYEEERTRERVLIPVEIALQNADAKVNELLIKNKALEEKIEAQRRSLHLISINRHQLNFPDKALFLEGLD